jgi:replicative DNA helicase
MNLPTHIQKAVDHGLLDVNEEGKVVSCKKDEVETIMGIARVVEKIQPTTTAQADETKDQEAIVLCRVLNAPSGIARELWSQLRIAFGVSHDQGVPSSLWSNPAFRAIGIEIDRTYLGQLETQLISRDSLIRNYSEPSNQNKIVQPIEFTKVVAELTAENAMAAYGDEESEWAVALDLLRKARVRAIYNDTIKAVEQAQKADTKLEKQIEFQQGKLMECLGMLRGSVGQQGNAKTSTDILYGVNGKPGLLDKIMDGRQAVQPVSTGIPAMDLDMEGGVYPGGGDFSGGRLFTLAARTGVGKTILAAQAAVGLAKGGLKVGFVSAELDEDEIWTRIWSCATRSFNTNTSWASVGDIKQPGPGKAEEIAGRVQQACGKLQEAGGEIMVEAPWGADVDNVINILRSMKAKNPEMRAAVIDHFHALSRHKGGPTNESGMMEDRAYKLMTVAKELGIDLIVLAQMNRVGMDALSSKQAPGLDQIRGTDALSHVSHAVWIARRVTGDDQPSNRNLEFWHAKTRGRQAIWNGTSMRGTKDFIEMSTLRMDYAHSGVEYDDTENKVN